MSHYESYSYYAPGSPEGSTPMTPEEKLWEQAFQASEISTQAQAHLDGLFEEVQSMRSSKRYTDVQQAQELEKEYWAQFHRLNDLKAVESELLAVLQDFDEGKVTADELAKYLPSDNDAATISKRRQAIERAKQSGANGALTSLELFMYGYAHWQMGPGLASDPRRIATGRNLSKLVARTGLTPYDAQGKFFEVTADTHGGKSRRPGKNGNFYVSGSGKRIRKR